jgi:hypothetical protein
MIKLIVFCNRSVDVSKILGEIARAGIHPPKPGHAWQLVVDVLCV